MSGTLMVSLDFELFWGMLDVCPLEQYQDHVLGGRKAIPRMLRLFREYDVHATWAAVGFLFAENKQEAMEYFPHQAPDYENPELSPYDWFDRIGDDEDRAPCFFAPSLLRLIADTQGQEIGSHTFCHYYCREKGQTPEQFREDMQAALKIAEAHGYHLTSAVLPRNEAEPEYIQVLRDLGFTAYRDEENDWIHRKFPDEKSLIRRILKLMDVYFPMTGIGGFIPRKEDGIWNFIGSRQYKAIFPALRILERLKVRRIKAQMLRAARKNLVCHIWWHPHNVGVDTESHLAQLEEIFGYYQELKEKYGMRSLNMQEAAEYYDQKL